MRIPVSLGIWIATAASCFAGEKEVIQAPLVSTSAEPAWSANFEGDYTFGSQNHFLPVGGFSWDISDRWTLNAGIPKTRLAYEIVRGADLYVGVEMTLAQSSFF